jgi:hypothetical protein
MALEFFKRTIMTQEQTLSALQKVRFNLSNPIHTQLIADASSDVKQCLNELLAIDKQLSIGILVGSAAFICSWLLPFYPLAIARFSYGFYQFGKRQVANENYQKALENLLGCCKWSLKEVPQEQDMQYAANLQIKAMLKTLAPVVSLAELKGAISDRVEDKLLEGTSPTNVTFGDFTTNDVKHIGLFYNLYGYHKRGIFEILGVIAFVIKEAFSSTRDYFNMSEATAWKCDV